MTKYSARSGRTRQRTGVPVYSAGIVQSIPTPEDVARTATEPDLIERNRQVTEGYSRFSERFREYFPHDATWPTFAAWASAQAGQTIRKEDLLRELERRLGDSPAVHRLIEGPVKLAASFVLRVILELNPFERSSQAVSKGNIKVYGEIGLVFARFLELLARGAGAEEHESLQAGLTPGPAPQGQDFLRRALPAYLRALSLPPGKERAEEILLGTAWIGFHEQTRLQPEIEASIDGSVWDFMEVKERLLQRLLPGGGWVTRLLNIWRRYRLEPLVEPVLREAQRLVREIVTARLMVIELPGQSPRLGQDLTGEFPPDLHTISNPELSELLRRLDPTPDSLRESGAKNWADFEERMHFILDLFRSRQQDARLFARPPER